MRRTVGNRNTTVDEDLRSVLDDGCRAATSQARDRANYARSPPRSRDQLTVSPP